MYFYDKFSPPKIVVAKISQLVYTYIQYRLKINQLTKITQCVNLTNEMKGTGNE